eukprot:5323323-Pleurochrysis_carterae.AAC.1
MPAASWRVTARTRCNQRAAARGDRCGNVRRTWLTLARSRRRGHIRACWQECSSNVCNDREGHS